MLFKQKHLDGIKAGTVSLAFRKWKKASVNKGSLIKTAIGLVGISDIMPVSAAQIGEQDALDAGFDNRAHLFKTLDAYPEGAYYRIGVYYFAADPRLQLRAQHHLDEEAYGILNNKLERLDRYSKTGPWTREILTAIGQYPKLKAADLAAETGKTKDWLKLNVRKLKNLGLTISHHPGYELSPLGHTFFKRQAGGNTR